MNISASILAADFSRIKEEIDSFSELIDRIHIDAMDGSFVPNIAFGPSSVYWINKSTHLPLEVHLYFKNPEQYLSKYLDAGANSILLHFESKFNLQRVIKLVKEKNVSFGLALNPNTSLSKLIPIIDEIDSVLLLLVKPGFGGQNLIQDSTKRIMELKEIKEKNNLSFEIIVDGGINEKTFKQVLNSGADTLVIGSAIFQNPNAIQFLQSIRKETKK